MTRLAVTMTEAGKLCGRSRQQVRKWVREGLPFIREGRRSKLILVSVLESWLKNRQVTVNDLQGGRI